MHIGGFEIIGGFVIFMVMLIFNSVGLFGSELMLVAIKIFFDFQHREGVIFMQPAIFCAAALRFIMVLYERDLNNHNQRIVDIKFASIMMPLVFIGAAGGEILHKMMSRIVQTTIFTILLILFSVM